MGLPDCVGRRYKLTSSTNFDEYMKEMGVGLMTRRLVGSFSPVMQLLVEGDQYILTSTTTFKTIETRFKLDEQFQQETPDGRNVQTTFSRQGEDTLVERQVDGDKVTTIVREFQPDQVKVTMELNNVVCTRIYTLQN